MRSVVVYIVSVVGTGAIMIPLVIWLNPPRKVAFFVPFGVALLVSWTLTEIVALRDKR